ncbi:hypothetical protein ADH76_07050 [Enterocloster clostridioformis]|nr:DUF4368 domain-containing protein [Enterocloster clostridioformis]OXE71072.1 hypothetical protein ADH76_07050 [Enterocloster clostridioformis]
MEEQAENIDRFIGKVRKYPDLEELTPSVFAERPAKRRNGIAHKLPVS